ncbi:MAG TPA: hypothetical protein PLS84_05145 [Salinivirgaceae bacterium]|nr:hypothetical protein [Salinivirgaceae bacterium]
MLQTHSQKERWRGLDYSSCPIGIIYFDDARFEIVTLRHTSATLTSMVIERSVVLSIAEVSKYFAQRPSAPLLTFN